MNKAELLAKVGAKKLEPVLKKVSWVSEEGEALDVDVLILPKNAGSWMRLQDAFQAKEKPEKYSAYVANFIQLADTCETLTAEEAMSLPVEMLAALLKGIVEVHGESKAAKN